MKVELKKKWVDALRSGEYNQTIGKLKDGKGYCCLGVLCDLVRCVEWNYDIAHDSYSIDDCVMLPPMEVRLMYDMTSGKTPITNKLATMNDDGASFSEIADYIEKNVPVDE